MIRLDSFSVPSGVFLSCILRLFFFLICDHYDIHVYYSDLHAAYGTA